MIIVRECVEFNQIYIVIRFVFLIILKDKIIQYVYLDFEF